MAISNTHLTVLVSSKDTSGVQHEPRTVVEGANLLDFTLPPELEAGEPPEARGLARDGVRLMVSRGAPPDISHHRFTDIVDALEPGDLLVINTSGTLNAALDGARADGSKLEVHLSTRLPGDIWTLELRQPGPHGTLPFRDGIVGENITLPAGATATLLAPYATATRGWRAALAGGAGASMPTGGLSRPARLSHSLCIRAASLAEQILSDGLCDRDG
jgi:S-adenosylmethionine:tRNA ribosyltransferase-isomerase